MENKRCPICKSYCHGNKSIQYSISSLVPIYRKKMYHIDEITILDDIHEELDHYERRSENKICYNCLCDSCNNTNYLPLLPTKDNFDYSYYDIDEDNENIISRLYNFIKSCNCLCHK
ncbi:Hypothetical protein ORPV_722 [Orpheovirus IHUMI-LCC2]|uniref:Uncharacterized protein n=1 Tax=Orpheovirus IHUMI-LCC2 TaxID=2023057 RepID=A0A2I2L529_9VIRU|nr:Hypothetical protein ORPV_722 [Orpheovirus IHUMI-LCC2]SNW62626.1 Hypothetical protein ORPV_722 [Orpheovirus IHUMI-LCC2]